MTLSWLYASSGLIILVACKGLSYLPHLCVDVLPLHVLDLASSSNLDRLGLWRSKWEQIHVKHVIYTTRYLPEKKNQRYKISIIILNLFNNNQKFFPLE